VFHFGSVNYESIGGRDAPRVMMDAVLVALKDTELPVRIQAALAIKPLMVDTQGTVEAIPEPTLGCLCLTRLFLLWAEKKKLLKKNF
jgi:hypothetical protein